MIGLMIPSVFSESTIQLYTDKKEYNMNDIIHITGKVNFVDGKAVGIGLPQGMKTVLEVYDSKNKLISTSIQDNISDTFFFDIDTGVNTKLNKDDRYTFLVFYGLVSPELRNTPNSSYVGNTHVYVGISAVEYSIKPPVQKKSTNIYD